MIAPYQQAISLVPKLTSDERRKLRVLLEKMPGASAPIKHAGRVETDDWLFDGIIKELARRGLVYRMRDIAKIRSIAPNYEADSLFVRGQMEKVLKHGLPDFTPTHLVALGRTSARCLADYITSWRRQTLGLKFMLVNASRTFEAVDRSFPGYLQGGMVSVLVQRSSMDD